MVLGADLINIVCAYAPQAGLGEQEKKVFCDNIDVLVRSSTQDQKSFIGGDFDDGHIGASRSTWRLWLWD